MADDKRRAAALCATCGTTHVVRIWPDGTVRPIGRDGSCECGEADFRILGEEIDPAETPDLPGESLRS